jgi:hypothetical protein
MKIRPLGAELFHGDRQAGRQTRQDKTRQKLIVALHNFANISKTHIRNTHKWNETLATWCLIINSSSTTTEISVFHGM